MYEEKYNTRILESWQEFEEFYAQSPQCVYRGQGNADWDLSVGFHRTRRILNPLQEQEMLRMFMSQAGAYSANLPTRDDYVSWFSLMQHYGAGTRLLDVTRSKYVALFFAVAGMCEGGYEKCAIWVFETFSSNINFYNFILADNETGCVDTRKVPLTSPLAVYAEYGWRLANHFIISDWEGAISSHKTGDIVAHNRDKLWPFLSCGGIMAVVPQIRNRRMIAQAAEYLMPITLRKSIYENLFDGYGCSDDLDKSFLPKVTKLIMSKSLANVMLKKLREMNVTWQTIYPDITGLSKEMNFV